MSAAARPAWTAQQRERLAAMGLALYVRAEGSAEGPREEGSTSAMPPVEGPPMEDPLLRALLRAAGVWGGGPGAEAVRAALPPIEAIRGNPEAKRALWPMLRALRREHRG